MAIEHEDDLRGMLPYEIMAEINRLTAELAARDAEIGGLRAAERERDAALAVLRGALTGVLDCPAWTGCPTHWWTARAALAHGTGGEGG